MHVAGVILDGDLNASVERLLAAILEHLHGVGDAGADATFGFAVFGGAEDDAVDGRANGLRNADAGFEMFFAGLPVSLVAAPALARGTNAPAAGIECNAGIVGAFLHVAQGSIIERSECLE